MPLPCKWLSTPRLRLFRLFVPAASASRGQQKCAQRQARGLELVGFNTYCTDEVYPSAIGIQYIPPALRSTFYDCCLIPLRKIAGDPQYDGGWKLLFLLPRMILKPHPRGNYIWCTRCQSDSSAFFTFPLERTVKFANIVQRYSGSSGTLSTLCGEERRRAAVKSVKCGELSLVPLEF